MNERHAAHGRRVALLTSGSLTKAIFTIALPIMIANTFGVAMELANAFFLGRVGSDALAAVIMAGAIVFFIMTFGAGLGIGTVALVARAYGERNYRKGEHIGAQSMVLGIILSVAMGAMGFLLTPELLALMGAKGPVHDMATTYLRIAFAGLPFMIFMFQAGAVFQGAGDTITPTKISAFATILNIVFDPIMIFGLLGFPALGVTGAAISSLTARVIGCALMVRVIVSGKHAVRLRRSSFDLDWGVMKRIFMVGFPGAIQMMLRSSSFLVMTGLAAMFGHVVIAAFGVGNRLFGIFLLPGFGFGAASSTIVGQNLGAKNPARAERGVFLIVAYYMSLILAVAIPLFIFSRQVAWVFNHEESFVALTSEVIRFVAAGAVFLPFGMIFAQALQGAGATVTPMIVTAVTLYGVQLPLAWYLSTHAGWGARGVWTANIISGLVNALLMSWMFLRGDWKRTRV
ncbi:MAG: MATE family efflux transporter [Candidatus Coatesbacteria bacterium]